jgi:tetratricopeptide (TPR) repeat protein
MNKKNMSANIDFMKSVNLYENGDLQGAIEVLERLVESNSNSAKLLATLANTYSEIGRNESALGYFHKAVQIEPQWEDASLGLFHCLWSLEKKEEALDEAKRFTAISSSKEYENIVREINQKM